MSISYSTYVGPYVRCAVQRVEAMRLHITCPNAGCVNYGKDMRAAFCGRCGAQVESLPEVYTDDTIDDWDVCERLRDRLCTASGDAYAVWSRENSAHLWKPNVTMPGRDPHLESHEDFALFDITLDQIGDELARFEMFFASEIVVLQEVYGKAAVSVHWGIIQDYN